jgi:hypothetical protein
VIVTPCDLIPVSLSIIMPPIRHVHTRMHQVVRNSPIPICPISSSYSTQPANLAEIQHAVDMSTSEGSRRNFQRSKDLYNEYCAQNHLVSYPASEETLMGFAFSFAGCKAGATVRVYISMLKKEHGRRKMSWEGGQQLEAVLKYVEKATPSSSRRPQRDPVTTRMLQLLVTDLDLEQSEDTAVYAVATAAFFGQLRLGEILSPTQDAYSPKAKNLPTVADLHISKDPECSPTLFLPVTKTTSTRGDTVALPKQSAPLDPITAVTLHIQSSSLLPHHPIASYYKGGRRYLLTKDKFLRRCNSVWSRHGYNRFTGHSFRIGGTTYYLLKHRDPMVVKVLGRWKSDAFLRYWRSLDMLASLHLGQPV